MGDQCLFQITLIKIIIRTYPCGAQKERTPGSILGTSGGSSFSEKPAVWVRLPTTPIYPFSPVEATPSTKYFCRHRNTINTGIRDSTDPAMIRP